MPLFGFPEAQIDQTKESSWRDDPVLLSPSFSPEMRSSKEPMAGAARRRAVDRRCFSERRTLSSRPRPIYWQTCSRRCKRN